MRPIICALLLAAAAAHAPAQTPERPAQAARSDERRCPDVRVTFSGGNAVVGGRVKFAATVSAAPHDAALTYRWQVSSGAIAPGQGGPEIEVDTRGMTASVLTATVTVGGLAPDCPDTASSDLPILSCALPFDMMGNLPRIDEEARLDNFAATLAEAPQTTGYIIAYGGRRGPRGDARARLVRMRRYLVGKRGIPDGRIVTLDGGYREGASADLIIQPPGAAPPAPVPTIDPSAVEFTDRPPGRRRGGRARAKRSFGAV